MDVYIGMIFMFGGNFAPRGFALCNGQLLAISSNQALFAILGTTFGGNGQTTFGLPDLRGRVPVHAGQGPGLSLYTLGEQAGNESTSLLVSNLPAHNHLLMGNNQTGGKEYPGVNHVIGPSPTDLMYSQSAPNVNMAPTSIGNTGSNIPFSNLQPLLAVNFVIATQGIFPSRN